MTGKLAHYPRRFNRIQQPKSTFSDRLLATLAGSIATIRLGGITELDLANQRYKVESAMWSVQAAIEEGCLPGGGLALLRAGDALEDWQASTEVEKESRSAVSLALEKPISQLIQNAMRSQTQLLIEVRKTTSTTSGFNATSGKIEDLIESGVLDPLKVLRLALKIAFSHVKSILQTATWDLSPS